jgi:hypothetical protein
MRCILILVATIYVLCYLIGWYMISIQLPFAVKMKLNIHNSVLTTQPFVSVIGYLHRGELFQAIIATFIVNFTVGAFLTTVLPGIIPLVGALTIAAVTMFRGFAIGVTYPEVLATSPATFVLGMGTLILELGAYVFSGAAGINIAIAPLTPKKYGVETRLAALKLAWIDAGETLIIVAVLLILGAIWEMTGLFLVAHG